MATPFASSRNAFPLLNSSNLPRACFSISPKPKSTSQQTEELLSQLQQIDSRGKIAFRQLYFPIKRIKFDDLNSFGKIYSYSSVHSRSVSRTKLIARLINFVPFLSYSLGYVFFINTNQFLHQAAIASLLLAGAVKSIRDSSRVSRQMLELYINANGTSFIGIIPNSFFNSSIHEVNTIESKDKSEFIVGKNAEAFEFNLEDIDQIQLLSNQEEKLNEDLTKTTPKYTSGDMGKKSILEKLKSIETTNEQLLLTISKNNWPQSQTFRMNLAQNNQSQYNDYLIALAYYNRIVMRSSLAPNTNQSSDAASSQSNENTSEAKEQQQQQSQQDSSKQV